MKVWKLNRKKWWLSALGIFAAIGVAFAIDITARIDGNTVNYQVTGATADSTYNVTIEHDTTNQGSSQSKTADANGNFAGSGTPGNSTINPGDTVTVKVTDANGNQVAGESFQKDPPKTPWWAYTGVGTIVWLLAQ